MLPYIGNEYFSADEESSFSDLDMMSVGPVVEDVEEQFDRYWNSDVVITVAAFDHNQALTNKTLLMKTLQGYQWLIKQWIIPGFTLFR